MKRDILYVDDEMDNLVVFEATFEDDFNITIAFEVVRPMPACVWVHERSGRDGSPTNITQVAVLLLP